MQWCSHEHCSALCHRELQGHLVRDITHGVLEAGHVAALNPESTGDTGCGTAASSHAEGIHSCHLHNLYGFDFHKMPFVQSMLSCSMQVQAAMLSCPKAQRIVEFAYYKEELIAVVLESVASEQPGSLLLIPIAALPWAVYSSPIHLNQVLQVGPALYLP